MTAAPVSQQRGDRLNAAPANNQNVVPFNRARLEAITALRIKLRENGYKPVPITAPRQDDGSFGKKPLLKNWQNVCAMADEDEIARWSKALPDHTNTGMLCGEVVAVDIDVMDAGLVAQFETLAWAMLGLTPLRRTGRAPKVVLVYRTLHPFTKMKTVFARPGEKDAAVEVLAEGQQFVAFGLHPGTGKDYVWSRRTPLDTPLAELPTVTEGTFQAFIAEAEALAVGAGYAPRGQSTAPDQPQRLAENRATDPPSYEEVAEAFRHIPNNNLPYDDWVRMGMALKAALGDAGRPIWEEWSARSSKNKPSETSRKWARDFNNVTSLTAGTIFYEAAQNGWVNPRSIAAQEVEAARIEAEVAEANRTADHDAIVLHLEQEGAKHSGRTSPAGDSLPPRTPDASANRAAPIKPHAEKQREAKDYTFVCAADVVMRPKDWLWKGHLLRGAQELLAGPPGLGKSQIHCHFAARATTGRPGRTKHLAKRQAT